MNCVRFHGHRFEFLLLSKLRKKKLPRSEIFEEKEEEIEVFLFIQSGVYRVSQLRFESSKICLRYTLHVVSIPILQIGGAAVLESLEIIIFIYLIFFLN